MLERRILSATPDQVALVGHLHSLPRHKIERAIEALIAICDMIDGDIEAEPSTWPEHHPSRRSRGDAIEDMAVEDHRLGFDPEEDMCLAGDDGVFSGSASTLGLMREHDGPGDSVDGEREQMEDDVPCIPVFTLEPNIFNGDRQLLGYTLPKPLRNGTMGAEI